MAHASKPVIFFDLWYTLFESDMAEDLKRIASLLDMPFGRPLVKHFEATFMTKPGLDQKVWAEDLLKRLDLPVKPELIGDIVKIIETGFDRQRPYPDTLVMLERLGRTHKLALITNTSQAALDHLNATYDLSERFDSITPSYAVGAVKPDKLIFTAALDAAGTTGNNAVMIGDNPIDDIEGARKAGFRRTILIDRRNRFPLVTNRIQNLYEISTLDA